MRLAAPSFIKKADRITNVRYLKEWFHEIELLYMSSLYEGDEPDADEVKALSNEPVRYNVHLPYDRDLSIPENWKIIETFTNTLRSLKAHTHTLHLQKEPEFFKNLSEFIEKVQAPITIENSENDTELFELITDKSVGICLDLGHVICHGQSVDKHLKKWGDRVELIHLHGTDSERDHKSIRFIDKATLKTIKNFALEHEVTVCLEVFNEKDLMESRDILLSL
jgi:hypothetical protein